MAHDVEGTWTVGRLLTWTTDFLKRKGSDSPRLDAEVLLAHVLKWERVKLYTRFEDEPAEEARVAFRDLVRRRSEGTPVAYLVGRKEFFSLALAVSPSVLIPRPDTETVVVEFLNQFKDRPDVLALDVGTGSGCIALACASRHPSARFVATDVSPDALAVAEANARTHLLDDRISFRRGSLFDAIVGDGPFDAIISNPPYIPSGDVPSLERGVRDFEPHLALDGGADGLAIVSQLIAGAASRLKPGGHLILEIGTAQEQPVRDLIAARAELELAPTIRDAAHHPRVVRAARR